MVLLTWKDLEVTLRKKLEEKRESKKIGKTENWNYLKEKLSWKRVCL